MDGLILKFAEALHAKIDAEYDKAGEMLLGGMLRDFPEVQHAYGYRKAMKDAKTLLTETLEEIMKE